MRNNESHTCICMDYSENVCFCPQNQNRPPCSEASDFYAECFVSPGPWAPCVFCFFVFACLPTYFETPGRQLTERSNPNGPDSVDRRDDMAVGTLGTARFVRHWLIHVTYGLKSFGVRELACLATVGRELGKLRELRRWWLVPGALPGHHATVSAMFVGI